MTDHANELRRHARKIPHPQGETPGVMLRAADEIERLRAKIEAMERQKPAGKFIQHPSNGLCVPDDGFKRGVECAVAFVARKAELYAIRFGDDDARRHILSVLVDELCGLFKVQPAPSVPDGWKLMPAISTYGMITAGLKTSHVLNVHRVLACYDAMFAAAPEAKP